MGNKKNWKRKNAALFLGLAACAGTVLGGCGKSSEPKAQDQGETGSMIVSDNLNATGLPILKEKETFVIAVQELSPIKKAAERNCVIQTEKETNVHIEWMEIPASGWNEKLNILFSTDSLPDAILGVKDAEMSKYYEQLVALDEYLDQYAPNTVKYFSARKEYPKSLIAPDGKIRCLPAGDESMENQIDSTYWINMDWLKKVGKEMPTTLDEFKDVLIAFRDQDPNGNGLKDEIPFTFKETWGWGYALENMFGPFGVLENDNHVTTRDGKVTFSPAEAGYYDALVYFHDLYQEGLIDKEAFTMSDEQYSSRGASGDILGVKASYSGSDNSVDDGEVGKERYNPLPPLKGRDGQQMVNLNEVAKPSNFVITKSCKDPAALVRWYDYLNSSLEEALIWGRGAKGERWEIVEKDGKEVPMLLTQTAEDLEKQGGYKTPGEYRRAETFAGQTPALWKLEYDENVVFDDKPRNIWKRETIMDSKQFGAASLPIGMADPENTDRRAVLKVDIDNYLNKFVSDSVINGIDQAKWDAHLKTLESLKADEYTKLCQDFADEYESR